MGDTTVIPFFVQLDLITGKLSSFSERVVRRLSDLRGLVADEVALRRELERGDRIVYEVFKINVPPIQGHLFFNVTVIHPGKIGEEYHFTKGHYHMNEQAAEIYIGVQGKGLLLMRSYNNFRVIEMQRGVLAYIPPGWGHRSVNVSHDPFVFLSIYPANAGYDYERIMREGMGKRVFATSNGQGYRIVDD
jgi:glucose-6-phosphate isomerase